MLRIIRNVRLPARNIPIRRYIDPSIMSAYFAGKATGDAIAAARQRTPSDQRYAVVDGEIKKVIDDMKFNRFRASDDHVETINHNTEYKRDWIDNARDIIIVIYGFVVCSFVIYFICWLFQ